MYKTIASILITLAIILGIAFYENNRLQTTFSRFNDVVLTLHEKTEAGTVTFEDGTAVEEFWESQKNTLHIWIPHTAILEIDYQLYEAVGYIYVRDFKAALPKLEILLGMCENIPQSYRFSIENVF